LRIQIARVYNRQFCCDLQFWNSIEAQPFQVCSIFTAISQNYPTMAISQNYPTASWYAPHLMIFAPFAGKYKIHWWTMATNEKEITKERALTVFSWWVLYNHTKMIDM
jgi:small neutral amino acid transporter SnatA (MarC family)